MMNVTKPSLKTLLRRWWTNKYKLPITSQEWRNSCIDDLVVEYLEDAMDNDEEFAQTKRLEYYGTALGPTDDYYIDLWEKQIASGEDPDLDLGADPREKDIDKRMQAEREMLQVMYPDHFDYASVEVEDDDDLSEEDVLSEEKISPAAFDQFIESAGHLKK